MEVVGDCCCSDGAGRTGTYCLIDMVLSRLSKGRNDSTQLILTRHVASLTFICSAMSMSDSVYTIQPVSHRFYNRFDNRLDVCINLLSNRLSSRFDNLLDSRLYRVYKHPPGCQAGCTSGLTSGWMFVYTMQPVVQLVVQPLCQLVVSCKGGISVNRKFI